MSGKRKLLFSFISVLLALGLTEAAFRVVQPGFDFETWREHQVRYRIGPPGVFRMLPGTYLPKKELYVINRLGFRGREPKLAKGAAYRIIVLGGSSAFIGKTPWPEILEQRLSRPDRPVEVINASCPGWSTYHTSTLLDQELMAYHPDLVVVYQLWNDLKFFALDDPGSLVQAWNIKAQKKLIFSAPPPNPWLDPISRTLTFIGYLRFRFTQKWKRKNQELAEGMQYSSLNHQIQENGVAFYQQNLERIIKTATAGGARVALVKEARLASANNTPAERAEITYRYVGFSHPVLLEAYRRGDAVLDRLCGQYDGVTCIDATALVPSKLEFFLDHVHLTGPGCERLADGLARELEPLIPAGGQAPPPEPAVPGGSR